MILEEQIFSGFCRTKNMGLSVTCEFANENGCLTLDNADCCYAKCIHRSSCEIAAQIRAAENGDR